jgi:hypothetical protein
MDWGLKAKESSWQEIAAIILRKIGASRDVLFFVK